MENVYFSMEDLKELEQFLSKIKNVLNANICLYAWGNVHVITSGIGKGARWTVLI